MYLKRNNSSMKKFLSFFLSLAPIYFITALLVINTYANTIIPESSEITALSNHKVLRTFLDVLLYFNLFVVVVGLFFIVSDLINKQRRLKWKFVIIFISAVILSNIILGLFTYYKHTNLMGWYLG